MPQDKSQAVVASIQRELAQEFGRQDVQRTWADDDVEIITVVGAGCVPRRAWRRGSSGRCGGERNVLAIAHGASDYSLSMVVRTADTERAVREIHRLVVLNGINADREQAEREAQGAA